MLNPKTDLAKFALTVACATSLIVAAGVGPLQAAAPEKPGGYPERDINVIIPFGPGGGSDQMMRALGDEMARIMEVDLRYVNTPGAGGMSALPSFAVSPPDGYTILQHNDSIVTGLAAGKHDLQIDEDIVPICIPQQDFSQIYINAEDDRFSDWESAVAYAKKSGETLKVAASSGRGSYEHMTVMQIAEGSGIDMAVVAFGNPGERVAAILGGHVDLYFEQPFDAQPYVEAGTVVPVLSIAEARPRGFDDAPALPEVGLGFEPMLKFRGIWALKSMPQERRAYLEEVCRMAAQSEAFQSYLQKTYTAAISEFYGSDKAIEFTTGLLGVYHDKLKQLGIIK